MEHFIGVDLAWSPRNGTAAVVLAFDGRRGRTVAHEAALGSDDEIVAFVEPWLEGARVAVDAPLHVPNESGTRACEKCLGAVYRRFHAGPHPANRRLLGGWNGGEPRGEALVARLAEHGLRLDGRAPPGSVFEFFPHAAIVELFGLDRILAYKARKGRTRASRTAELGRLADLLAGLADAAPSADLPSVEGLAGMRGKRLKQAEDLLDAAVCAYGALHVSVHGGRVFGDAEGAHIVVPRGVRPT